MSSIPFQLYILCLVTLFLVPTVYSVYSPSLPILTIPQVCNNSAGIVQCTCNSTPTILHIQLQYIHAKKVLVQSCKEVFLVLDLSDVSKSNIDLHIKDCGEVQIANIQFEETSVEEHKLRVELDNLEKFTIHNQTITSPMTVSAVNVREILLYRTHFSQLPSPGLTVEKSDKVSIIDCVFQETSPGAISVETVTQVEIVNNKFPIDTLEVVTTKESPNLYISCNHLHHQTVSMECISVSSTLHSVSSSSSLSESLISSITSASLESKSEKHESYSLNIVLWIFVAIGFIFLTIFLGCFLYNSKNKKKATDEEHNDLKTNIETETHEKELILTPENDLSNGKDNDTKDIIERVKEQEAILHQEIQGS